MRIRTATAAAVLATAALFGSAGTALAHGGDHYSQTNKKTNVNWEQRVNDFSDAVLAHRISTSDNDSYHSQDWTNTNIDGNFVNSFSGKFHMGDFEMED